MSHLVISDHPNRFLGIGWLCMLLFGAGCAGAPETSAEWPQFRGPNGQGVSPETNLPVSWRPEGKNVRWKTLIPGHGDSSPVVSGGRVFVTTVYGIPTDNRATPQTGSSLKRVVVGIDLRSGEVLWQRPVFEGGLGKIHWLNSRATPTPAADGKTLFVSFDAHLAALDYDGRILWKKDLEPDYSQNSRYGAASSPVVTRDAVILFQDREDGDSSDPGWLIACDKKTGEVIWRHEWKDSCCSYTTPIVVERDSREILIMTTSYEAIAYDAGTGERLWQVQHRNLQPVPSVAVWEDFVTFPGAIHDALLLTFRLGAPGEGPEFLWGTRQNIPDIPSPLYYQGRLFTLNSSGILANRNPRNGNTAWRHRLPSTNYRAALVAGDGKIYAVNVDGNTTVIDVTSRELKVIGENALGEGSSATPAIADGCLIIRGSHHLFCIEKEAEAVNGSRRDEDLP